MASRYGSVGLPTATLVILLSVALQRRVGLGLEFAVGIALTAVGLAGLGRSASAAADAAKRQGWCGLLDVVNANQSTSTAVSLQINWSQCPAHRVPGCFNEFCFGGTRNDSGAPTRIPRTG